MGIHVGPPLPLDIMRTVPEDDERDAISSGALDVGLYGRLRAAGFRVVKDDALDLVWNAAIDAAHDAASARERGESNDIYERILSRKHRL